MTIHKQSILIVEDTESNIDILTSLLEDYNTKVAINGELALKMLEKNQLPDLILLDILMPGINGFEVCRRIRDNKRTKDIPIIFLSVKDEQDDILKGFDLGGQDYITKPFDSRELMKRVMTQLELKSQREKLKDMNKVLDIKVKERTSQLQGALSQLDIVVKELHEINMAKSNFLHMISHELRTPLNGIMGVAYQLSDSDEINSDFRIFSNTLQANVDRLEQFSTKALLITELQTNYYKPDYKIKNIKNLIEACIISLKQYSNDTNIEISKSLIDPDLEIKLDEHLVQKVLISILENAIQFSKKNGVVKVNAYKEENQSIIEIIDNGDGFADQSINCLTHAFTSDKPYYDNNTGLSLFLAQIIMKKLGGHLVISKVPKSGASVKLIF